MSEREHGYEFPHPSAGFVDAQVLVRLPAMHGAKCSTPGGESRAADRKTFRLQLVPGKRAGSSRAPRPSTTSTFDVRIDGEARSARGDFRSADGWREAAVDAAGCRRAA